AALHRRLDRLAWLLHLRALLAFEDGDFRGDVRPFLGQLGGGAIDRRDALVLVGHDLGRRWDARRAEWRRVDRNHARAGAARRLLGLGLSELAFVFGALLLEERLEGGRVFGGGAHLGGRPQIVVAAAAVRALRQRLAEIVEDDGVAARRRAHVLEQRVQA